MRRSEPLQVSMKNVTLEGACGIGFAIRHDLSETKKWSRSDPSQTLNLKSMTSPSFTTYSLPSMR